MIKRLTISNLVFPFDLTFKGKTSSFPVSILPEQVPNQSETPSLEPSRLHNRKRKTSKSLLYETQMSLVRDHALSVFVDHLKG